MEDISGNDEPLTMGQFAERTGCDRETIRYYERISLIASPTRSASGYRLYQAGDIRRLGFILRCRQLGFSIDEVRSLLGLVDENKYTCSDIQSITQKHLTEIRKKLRDMRALERALKEMVAGCKGGQTPDCPIIDALFK